MSSLEHRLEQDRALRDAARRQVEADVAVLTGEGQERGFTERAKGSAEETSMALAEQAKAYARDNPLIVGGGALALLLVLLRDPLIDFALSLLGEDDEDDRRNQYT